MQGWFKGIGLGFRFVILAAATAAAGAAPRVVDDPAPPPTFSGQIAGIVYNNCTQCHRPDGGAPFSFTSYDEIRKRARLIATVTESGFMPPWKVAHSDLRFKNERHLSEAQRTALMAWYQAGAPIGDPEQVPPAPQYSSGWVHGTPDILLEMEEDMPVPASGVDIYRNFVVRIPDLPEGHYLKGIEYRPRAINTAHHTLFSLDATGRARRQSEAQPRPGFSGGGSGGGAMGRIAGWAVGSVPAMYPEGAAMAIAPGTDLVLASHFHPTGKEEVERAQIALYLTDEEPTRYINTIDVPFMFGVLKNIRIPAGDPHYVVRESYTVPIDALLTHLSPHAHYLAKSMKAVATLPEGKVLTLIDIGQWDFGWQEQYELANEVPLPKGTVIDMEFVYDNSPDNPHNPSDPPQEVIWGLQSTDEMASISLGIITPTLAERDILRREYIAWVKDDVATADPRIALASFRELGKERFDLDGDGEVTWGEAWQMVGQARNRFAAADGRAAASSASSDMRALRNAIFPVAFRRILWFIVLPWLLPRAILIGILLAAVVYALRRWRRARRKSRAAMAEALG